jgi:hypothetical protein
MQRSSSWLRRIVRDYAVSIAFWLAASPLVGWQMYYLERRAHIPISLRDMLLVYAARYLSVALLTPPIFYLVSRWPVTGSLLRRTTAYVLGYVPFSVAFAVIRWLILPPWMEESLSFGPRNLGTLFELVYVTFADVLLLYLAVVVAAHAYAYFVRGQRQEIERLQLRQCLAQSELQTLRAQLHPHFLFNTLQGVSTLIDTDRGTAQNMLLTLAGLLRKVLKYGSTDLIAFSEELAFVESYLQLEQMRLGRRLAVRWQITPEVRTALIPQLLLQPLIENAVVHGIANSRDGGWIEIAAHLRQGRLVVAIRNSIGGASQSGLGVGIKNTRARLKYLYGEDAAFEFEILEARVALARVIVPALKAHIAEAVNA